jgi:hypothetical protein
MVYVESVDSNFQNFVLRRNWSDNEDCRVDWEIIEYTGDPGGAHAIEVRDRDFVTVGTGDLSDDSGTVDNVVTDSDVVVFITGQAIDSPDDDDTNSGQFVAEWIDEAGNDRARFTRGEVDNDYAAQVSYAVVEFTGSAWSVWREELVYNATSGTKTFNPTVDAVAAHTFIHVQHQGGSDRDEVHELGEEVWLSADNELSFQIELNVSLASTDIMSAVWMVTSSDDSEIGMHVNNYSGTRAVNADSCLIAGCSTGSTVDCAGDAGTPCEEDGWTETITPVLNMSNASVMGETARASSAANGDDIPRGSVNLRLTATDTVDLRQSDNDANIAYRFSIVQWPSTFE